MYADQRPGTPEMGSGAYLSLSVGRNDNMQMEKNAASPARARLAALYDGGEYREFGTYVTEREQAAGVVTAYGFVNGNPVYAFAQDQSEANGAVGAAQAEKISKVYTLAAKTGAPVVGIYDSNGAFMDGTAVSLNAYSLIMKRVSQLSGVVPQIALVAGVCAGSAAMAASSINPATSSSVMKRLSKRIRGCDSISP